MTEKILVINDDEAICDLLSVFLKQKGYAVILAYDGISGLQKAEVETPDLILLDIVMPNLDGYGVCEKLKQNPLTRDIPVIFLSSLTETKDKIRALELGGVDFVNRVTDKAELLARVQAHLRIRALNKELILRNEELVQKQKHLDADLAAAAVIQQSLLPHETVMKGIKMAWSCLPCEQVGGDIFNIIRINDDQVIFYILDVSGHGVPSAMISVSVSQQIYHSNLTLNSPNILSPQKMMNSLDKDFPIEKYGNFFTMFYMVMNTRTGAITFSNAGHPPAIILHPNKSFELLRNTGTVIGINESLPYAEKTMQLEVGDKIILYTDGVTEYQNPKGELFGEKRLCTLLEKTKEMPMSQIVDVLCKSLEEYGEGEPSHDDVSIIGVEFNGHN